MITKTKLYNIPIRSLFESMAKGQNLLVHYMISPEKSTTNTSQISTREKKIVQMR
jgi:hypothetical protein